jgi:16S rRNA G966 N2-methylase RsmD
MQLIEDNYTENEKIEIAKNIKLISLKMVDDEFNKLVEIGKNANTISPRSRIGNNIVDYFTFVQRLKTKGKYNVNFYEFLQNIDEFKKKKFIQTMLTYYADVKNNKNKKHEHIVLKEVYNICISAINIMRPLNCMEIYTKYKCKRVLNCCTGWGGTLVAAAALNIEAFYGQEINKSLEEPYHNMIHYLSDKTTTELNIRFCNSLEVDYSKINYDTVFTSPPYYNIQIYENNTQYNSKKEMNETFYKPLFLKTYNGLQQKGHFIINVCAEVYNNVLKNLFGEAHEIFPLKKSQRQNNYRELVYVWVKNS